LAVPPPRRRDKPFAVIRAAGWGLTTPSPKNLRVKNSLGGIGRVNRKERECGRSENCLKHNQSPSIFFRARSRASGVKAAYNKISVSAAVSCARAMRFSQATTTKIRNGENVDHFTPSASTAPGRSPGPAAGKWLRSEKRRHCTRAGAVAGWRLPATTQPGYTRTRSR
jgi:hypothetical protein